MSADNLEVVPIFEEDLDKFTVPQLEVESIVKLLEEKVTQIDDPSDHEIIWRVNKERFDVELMNGILVKAATRNIDETHGFLYKLILQIFSDKPFSFNELEDAVSSNECTSPILLEQLHQYLMDMCLEDSSGFITQMDDADKFAVDYTTICSSLACSSIDSIIDAQFGSNATKIFRFLRSDPRRLSKNQIYRFLEMSESEVNISTRQLIESDFLSFIHTRGPSGRSVVKYYIEFFQVVWKVLHTRFKNILQAMENLMDEQMPAIMKEDETIFLLQRYISYKVEFNRQLNQSHTMTG